MCPKGYGRAQICGKPQYQRIAAATAAVCTGSGTGEGSHVSDRYSKRKPVLHTEYDLKRLPCPMLEP